MTRAVLPLLTLALGVSLLGAFRSPAVDATVTVASASQPLSLVPTANVVHTIAAMLSTAPVVTPTRTDRVSAMRRLRAGQAGTYIGEILQERDSAIIRWPDRRGRPLTVWIQSRSPVNDFVTDYVASVRRAFLDWDSLNLPLHFLFVADSADAEVHVTWTDHFTQPISGRTRWTRDDDWTITDANILLAVHHSRGERLDAESMRAMALHEIGHLIGLDHTTDTMTVMAPKVRVRELTDEDRATARLLYELPAGRLASR